MALAKGNVKAARGIVRKISRVNSNSSDKIENIKNNTKNVRQGTLKDILKMSGMRRNLLLLCLYWFGNSMGAYGLIFYTPSFDWSVYLVFVFPSFINIPMLFVTPFLENR